MKANGLCDPRFELVREAFEANFAGGTELGASVAVTLDGEFVVDLWAGDKNSAGDPWEKDTICNVYSTTKTMASSCMLMLADRGAISFDEPVSTYWPEFAANGKSKVLLSHVMSHQTGCSGFPRPVTASELYDHALMADLLAGMKPWWEPGTGPGYHAITQGTLQAEVLRRVDGRSLGTFFKEEIAEPLGADFHIGLSASEGHRVADLKQPGSTLSGSMGVASDSIAGRTFDSCILDGSEPLTQEWRSAEIPAAGGIGNARSVARVHSMLACGGSVGGVKLMSPEAIELALVRQTFVPDKVLGMNVPYGMGFGINHEHAPITPSKRTLYWFGWGGSMGIIDLDQRLSIAYVMNNMADELLGDSRALNIAAATYAAL